MQTWVALLRGVNVGGVRIAMASLRSQADSLGWQDVQSYIASGNLVFRADGTATGLAADLAAAVDVDVLVLAGEDLRERLAACPFDPVTGKHVHGIFCFDDSVFEPDAYADLKIDSEVIEVMGRTVWLLAPGGVGRSKLVEKFHKVITGTRTTARNLNTIRKLVEMLD